MKTNQSNFSKQYKLLFLGAFIALSQFAFGQSSPYVYFPTTNDVNYSGCEGDTVEMAALSLTGNTSFKWEFIPFNQSTGTQISTTATAEAFQEGIYRCSEYDASGNLVGTNDLSPVFYKLEVALTATNSKTRNAVVSNGSVLNTSTPQNSSPVGVFGYYTSDRALRQFLVTSNELQSAGIYPGAPLKSLSFDIQSKTSNYDGSPTINDFKIELIPTTSNDLSLGWETSPNSKVVFDDYWLYQHEYNTGQTEFEFNQDFIWDGISNLVIQVSYMHSSTSVVSEEDHLFRQEEKLETRSRFTTNSTAISLSQSNGLLALTQTSSYLPNIQFKTAQKAYPNQVVFCDDSGVINSNVSLVSDQNGTEPANSSILSFSWSNSSSTSETQVSSAGDYWLETTHNSLGCTSKDTVEVSFSQLNASISANNTKVCNGDNITLTIDNQESVNSYGWSNGEITNSISVSSGTSFTLTEIDTSGCVNTSEIDLHFQDIPELVVENGTDPAFGGASIPSYTNDYLGAFEGHQYYLIRTSTNWQSANQNSENLGGHLLVPSSQSEMNWVGDQIRSLGNYDEAFIGVHFDGVQWVSVTGEPLTFTNWWGDPNGNPYNDEINNPVAFKSYWGEDWYNESVNSNRSYIVEFPPSDAPVTSNSVFCDSIKLKATRLETTEENGFDVIYWTNANGDTISDSEYYTFSNDSVVVLNGLFTRSDGQTCVLSSASYSIDILASPNLVVTNYSNTADLDGGDTIVLVASTDAGTVSWIDSAGTVYNNDTLLVTTPGIYTARASTASCESMEEIRIDQPLYVAKTGSDVTGDGSFANPYLTIQKGIDEASEGGKIYVLPGTYNEGELNFETTAGSYKSVYLASDFVRLGAQSAITSTKIDADGDDGLFDIQGANTTIVDGFTLTGMETSQWESSLIYLTNGATPVFRNIEISGNTWSNDAMAPILHIENASPEFENVTIKGHGSQMSTWRSMARVSGYSSEVVFTNVIWKDNYAWDYGILGVWDGAKVTLVNNLFLDNYHSDWRGILNIHNGSNVTLLNTTIANNLYSNQPQLVSFWDANSTTTLTLINSVLGENPKEDYQIYNNGGNQGKVIARNSVIPFGVMGSNQPSKIDWDVDASNVFSNPRLGSDGKLQSNSPAIGIGTQQNVLIGSTSYTPPATDLAGVTRPDPVGSSPDAGAYESDKAQGDFDILLSQCGYLLDATVLNSNAYSVAWMFNGDTVSTSESFVVSSLGTYTFYAESTDRSATLSENIAITDPLRFVMMGTKNNCTDVGSSNGYIRWGQPEGGTTNNNNNYYSWVLNSSGGYQWGNSNREINRKSDNNGYHEVSSLGDDTYYVTVSDATGCSITDTVEIVDQDQDMYFVSTDGSDLNAGTSELDAWGSIEYALSQVCDEDTIILLDGTYYEDSLTVTRDLVLGSKYLLDGDEDHIANTIIDGDNDGWIMAWQAGNNNWSDTTSNQLVGLTIQNGNSTNGSYAGGLSVWHSRVLKINNVHFNSNNNSLNQGGGLWNRSDSYVELSDVLFENNTGTQGGAGMFSDYTYLRMMNVAFTGNYSQGDGAALWINGSRSFYTDGVSVKDHNVPSNDLIRVRLNGLNQDAQMLNWQVSNNASQGRTMRLRPEESARSLTIENMLFVDNVTTNGVPGIWFREFRGTTNIVNSTFADNSTINSSSYESGAVLVFEYAYDDPTVNIFNTVVAHSTDYTIAQNNDYTMTLNIENSFVSGGTSKVLMKPNGTKNYGTTNLSTGLYFTDASNGDYSLSSVSTLLGAGASTATVGGTSLSTPAFDLFGNIRSNPAGTNPDLGAIESADSTAQVGMAAVVTNNGFCQTASGAITANLLNYTGTATYSWSSATYSNWTWNSTQSATALASGTYKLVASDATTGVKIDSVEVVVATQPGISITNTSTDVTCFGDDDGELSFEIAGGSPLGGSQYTYSINYQEELAEADGVRLGNNWYNDDNHSGARSGTYISDNWNGSPNYQGSYYVTVSDQDGCSYSDSVKIGYTHELPAVEITTLSSDGVTGLTSMCEGTGNTISLTADVTGGGGTNAFSWSNASTAQTVGVAQTDDYYVEVTDQYTCVGKDTVNIYFQAAPALVIENGAPAAFTGQSLTGAYSNDATYLGEYENHHYYGVRSWQSWTSAKAIAESLGGKLFIPNSYAEGEAVDDYIESENIREEYWIGVYWDGDNWVDINDQELSFSYWWGSTSNVNPYDQPYSNYPYARKSYWSSEWYNTWNTDTKPFIIEFAPQDAPVVFNQSFCDSVELKANKLITFSQGTGTVTAQDQGFTQIYWKDENGTVLDSGAYAAFSQSETIQLEGVFTRSDGTTCSIVSDAINVKVYNSPELTFTTVDSLSNQDYLGSDVLACEQSDLYSTVHVNSDTTGILYSWSNGTSDSLINIDSTSIHYVTVTDILGCFSVDTISVFKKQAPQISKSVIKVVDTSMMYTAPYIPDFYYQGRIGDKYIYSSNYSATWSQARQDALALGGDLASFSSEQEYNTLKSWAWNEKLVGLNDSISEGIWEFSDGNPVTYYPPNWGQGEPNNAGNEDYITISNYSFNDVSDYSSYEFLIQVPVPPTEVPVMSGEEFCDSVELIAIDFAKDSTKQFDKVYWRDASNGVVMDSTEKFTIYTSNELYLEGFFTQSNGSECSVISDTINVVINETPDLVVYSADSTYEMTGDSLILVAYSNSSSASLTWMSDTLTISNDTAVVYDRGSYVATVTENGCSISKEVFVDQPIFVAKTGSDITGTGSLTKPYKTIQFAIDTANSGQKIYVLPGTYSENLLLDKQVRIFSDFERLGNASAISATQISGSNTGPVFTFQGESYDDNGNWRQGPKWTKDSTIISGFTIRNGYGNGQTGGGFQSQSNYYATSGVLVKNAVIRNNTNICCNDGIVAQMDMPLHFENVAVRNNGSPTNYDERTLFAFYHNKETVWKNVKFYSNEAQNHLIRLTDNQTFIVENSLFYDNIITDNEQALFGLDGNVTLVLNHTTIENSSGQGYAIKFDNSWGNQEVILFNSIVGPHSKGSIHTTSSAQKVYAHNSVISSVNGAFHGSGGFIKSGNTIEAPTMGIGANHKLTSSSPALGIGGSDTTLAGISLVVPEFDLAGFSRPLPAGSSPDAGAYEDSLQRGDFDMYLDQCGLLAWASPINGGNYQITWLNGLDTLSNSDSAFVPSVGTYSVVGYSEYGDTLTKLISVTNPLSIELLSSKDACVDISQNSGSINFDSPQGGTPYGSSYWYDYVTNLTGSNDTNGYSNRQEWYGYQQLEFTGLAPGEYVLELNDGSGCSVYDTVSVGSKYGQTVYVAVNGDDLNDGSELTPLATINEALSRLCDGDSVIIEQGTYFENVVMPDGLGSVTIMSRFGLNSSDSSIIDQTIINGDANGRVIDVFTNNNSGNNSDTVSIVGLTIKNGYVSNYNSGGGIAVRNRTLDLRSSTIIGNEAYNGGGIYAYSASLLLSDVDITNNTSRHQGGGIYTSSSIYNYIVDDVIIENNTAQEGGGIYLYNYFWTSSSYEDEFSNFIIRNNVATSNGGGVYAYLSSSGRIVSWKNWIVTGNVATNEGGAVYMNGYNSTAELHVVNSIFYGNKAGSTPGIYVQGGDVNLIHSTIASNQETSNAWSTYKNSQLRVGSNANVQLWNSIIAGDRTETYQIVLYDQGSLTSHKSLIDGGNAVIYLEQDTANSYQSGNTYSALNASNWVDGPFTFVDEQNGNFTPSGNTSAIGGGLASFSGPVFPIYDITGAIRPDSIGTMPDLGAVESDLSSPEFGVGFSVTNNTACAVSIATIEALAQQGTAPYDYYFVSLNPTQNPISGTASFTNKSTNQPVTIANLFSGVYGCYVVDDNGDSAYAEVEVIQGDSVEIIVDKTPIFCAGDADGELTATVLGGNGQYAVNWIYPNQSSYSSYSINNLDTGVYTFSVTSDGCIYNVTDTILEVNQLSPISITSSINKNGTIVTDGAEVRMCIGDEVTFDAGIGYISYLWETQDGFNSQTTQTIGETGSKNYFLTAIDTNGCYNYDTASVYVVYEPNVFASNVNVVSSAQTPQVTSYLLGDEETPDNFYYYFSNIPKPYGSSYKKGRTQFIISASELQSAGLTENTTINSLGFEVESAGSIVQQFEIRMSHTTQQQLSYYENDLDLVYQIAAFTPTEGWVTHNLNNSWTWDGVSNIVVDVQYDNFNYGSLTRIKLNKVNSGITLALSEYDNNSIYGNTNSSEWRPNVRFGIDKVEVADTIRVCDFSVLNTTDDYDQYQWYVNGIADTNVITKYLDQPADIFLLAVDAASQCYMYSDTFNVALDTTPVVDIILSNSVICIGDTVFADAGIGYASYSWSNGSSDQIAQLFTSGSYLVAAASDNGCPGYDTVNVTVNTPPDLIIELNGEVLTSADSDAKAGNSGCSIVSLLPYSNNFEDSLVVWNQSTDDELDWISNSGTTDTDFSGPNNDTIRSLGDSIGTYLFINRAGANSDDNKIAYLTSNCIDLLGSQSPFLEFYYHMYDGYASVIGIDQMGSLEVQVRDVSQGSNYWLTVFNKSGNQGNTWYKGNVDLTQFVGTTIQIRVKGIAGIGGPRSEMAIDGFSVLDTTIGGSSVIVNNGRTPFDRVCEGDKLFAKALIDDLDVSSTMSYTWNDGRTGSYITLDSTGWYSVVMTDTSNCEVVSDSVFVEVSPGPNNNLLFSDLLTYCEGDFNGLFITVEDSSNTSYEWFKNTPSIFNQGTGDSVYSTDLAITIAEAAVGTETYVLKVTDSVGCSSFSEVAELIIHPKPNLILSEKQVLCFGESNGEAKLDVIGSGGYEFTWNTGDTIKDLDSLSIGTYVVTVVDTFSCEGIDSIIVSQPSLFTYTSTSIEDVKCYDGSDGTAIYNVAGGVGNYSYSWTDSSNTWASSGKDLEFAPIGTYYVSAQDSNGCTILDTVRLEQPTELVLTLDSTKNLSCFQSLDGQVWASVEGGSGNNVYYLNGDIVSDVDNSALSAGSYTLVVQDDNGCQDSVNFMLTEPQLLSVTYTTSEYLDNNQVSCFGSNDGSIDINVNGGTLPYEFVWSDSTLTEDRSTLTSGTYSVDITDAQGCEVSTTAILMEPSQLVATSVVSELYCFGDSTAMVDYQISGGVGPYISSWDSQNGNVSDSVQVTFQLNLRGQTPDATGVRLIRNGGGSYPLETALVLNDSVYRVTLTMAPSETIMYRFFNGSAAETVNPTCGVNNSVSVIERTFTAGARDTSLAVVGFSECTTYGGARSGAFVDVSRSIVGLSSDIYLQTITDMNGCTVVLSDTVSEPAPLVLALDSVVDVSCKGLQNGAVYVDVTGGNGGYTYAWNGIVSSDEDLMNVSAGTYTLIVVDSKGCTDSLEVTVTEPDSLIATYVLSQYVGGNNVSCNGAADGSFDVILTGGTLPYEFAWNTSDTTEDLSGLGQGFYSVLVTDSNGCSVTVSDSIIEPAVLTATISATDVSCNGGTDGTVAVNATGGSGPYTMNWTTTNGAQINNPVGVTFRVDMTGQVVAATGTDVVFGSGGIVDLVSSTDSIYQGTAYYNVGDTVKYRFFNGAVSEVVPVSCGVTQNLTLFEREFIVTGDTTLPAVEFGSCTTSLSGVSGYSVLGSDTLSAVTSGTYTVEITDANGCTLTLQDSVTQPDVLTISVDSILNASCPQTVDGTIATLVSGGTGNYNFVWSSGDTTQNILAGYGNYSLTVTDENGCQDTASFFVDAPFPYNDEEVCVVTVDTTGVNLVVWDKTPNKNTAEYIVLRENASTQYVSIGSNAYNDLSTFADQNSNPAVQPYRYKLVVQDSCGNYSDTSDYHATIHLQASPGVASNEVQLQWTAYEGKQVQTYYIYRWLSPSMRVLVDSVSSNVQTYTDIYPVTTTITALLYEVGAKFVDAGCSPTAGKNTSYVNSLSNRLDWGSDGGLPIGTEEWVNVVLENDLEIYPNPSRGKLNVSMTGAWEQEKNVKLKVMDMTGRTLAVRTVEHGGTVSFDFTNLPAGVYFLHTMTNDGRIIVKRFERIN